MILRKALEKISESERAESFPAEMLDTEFIPQENDLALDDETIRRNALYCSLSAECADFMVQGARRIRENEAAAVVIQSMYRAHFLHEGNSALRQPYPAFQNSLNEYADAANLIFALGFVPLVLKLHQKYDVPEHVTRDTCHQLCDYCRSHTIGRNGRFGIYPNQMAWMRCYVEESLLYLRFTRLEFMTKKNNFPVRVYRSKTDSSLAVFCGAQIHLDKFGFAVQGPDDPDRAYASDFLETDDAVSGHTIFRDGHVSAEPKTIQKKDYDLILGPGMPVLDMHIPSGGGMSEDLVTKSFQEAKTFYSQLKDASRHPAAVMCYSWIFNPNLPDFLPADANLVKMLRRVHPVPVHCGSRDGLWFIYLNDKPFDVNAVPRNTSLRKAVAEYIEAGNRWRIGGMFLLMNEIPEK